MTGEPAIRPRSYDDLCVALFDGAITVREFAQGLSDLGIGYVSRSTDPLAKAS